jgi:hypothetical protein
MTESEWRTAHRSTGEARKLAKAEHDTARGLGVARLTGSECVALLTGRIADRIETVLLADPDDPTERGSVLAAAA